MYEKINDPAAGCDLCGRKPDDGQLYSNEKHLHICSGCKKKLEEMPRATRENLENYLIGNVM